MRRVLRRLVAVTALATVLATSWFIAAYAEDRTIEMSDVKPHYRPPNREVNPGDRVRWHNTSETTHEAKADNGAFNEEVAAGKTSSFVTLTQPGTYTYRCTLSGDEHKGAEGTIVVKEAPDPEFSPSPQTTPEDLSTALPPDEQAAPSSPSPAPSPSPTPSPSPSPTPSESPSPRAVGGESRGGISPAAVVGIIGLVVAAGAGGGIWWYRRKMGPAEG